MSKRKEITEEKVYDKLLTIEKETEKILDEILQYKSNNEKKQIPSFTSIDYSFQPPNFSSFSSQEN